MNTDPKQPAGKYMDVTHPAHTRPSATSRPIIVPNRPMLAADPMINESAELAATVHKTDSDSSLVETEAQNNARIEPPKELLAAPSLPTKQSDDAKETVASPEVSVPAVEPADTEEPEPRPVFDEDTAKSETEPDTDPKEATEPHKEATKPDETPAPNAAVQTTPVIDIAAESDAPSPEDEAAARNEQLIADATYFLPIGQVKHRGQRLVFGLCLIVVLAVVVLDVLLDTGSISLSGIPHTTFFGS